MKLLFTETGWDDYQHWQANDRDILEKVNTLLKDCRRSPFSGIGKPEALRGDRKGWWSRRITKEHRLVYRVEGEILWVNQCRFHYDKN
ncbi:Txe/YoeB family addiction module toxin [Devosia rhizoryzae]|uniref:Putative mRNA interferase YoeB n=1 Tax=Devosia rhizoryzae TaxID=2774137 RepID=A0ABX7C5Q9_9HYPH|nr:Txe/YoeB family addiction module toxin [Devosia rhizoryzae]QQR39548.1 Txe/YoeB family addiction module toxin [Devosia rhizoryzae]